MIKRLPHKRGFNNPWRVQYEVFNVGELARRFPEGGAVDMAALEAAKLRSSNLPIKILGDGEIAVALTVTAHKISKSAREKIEAAGGTANELGVKEVHGDRRDIVAEDVTITHGETPRTVDVRTKKREAKARRRATPGAAAEGGEDNA